jgi:hypothetical protein
MIGMAPATLGPLATVTAAGSPSATTPDVLDRAASTKTLTTDVDPVPQHGTDALPASLYAAQIATTVDATTLPVRAPALSAPPTALSWPPERRSIRSEDPQVRSLPLGRPVRPPAGAVLSVALGTAALMVLAGVLIAALHGDARPSTAAAAHARVPPAPMPEAVVALPAPTLEPPAFDDEVSAATPSASASGAVGSAPSTVVPPPSGVPKKAKLAAPHFAPDRPGPGF